VRHIIEADAAIVAEQEAAERAAAARLAEDSGTGD
jgi:hypothetical protein